jgi:hypothetical protein
MRNPASSNATADTAIRTVWTHMLHHRVKVVRLTVCQCQLCCDLPLLPTAVDRRVCQCQLCRDLPLLRSAIDRTVRLNSWTRELQLITSTVCVVETHTAWNYVSIFLHLVMVIWSSGWQRENWIYIEGCHNPFCQTAAYQYMCFSTHAHDTWLRLLKVSRMH